MRRLKGLAGVFMAAALLGSCSSPAGSVVKIPTEATAPAGASVLCPTAAFTPFTLAGDPTKSPAVWGINSYGQAFPITWPSGFTARFNPTLQIVDPTGAVVATGGVVITDAGGGGDGSGDNGEYLCIIDGKTY
ncbi:MAG TPA: hypothetical protein VKR21_16435 [Solirubrobacteraceae bacterium]|nr:hypothetical protein [Solirubrobacteraceae bacterium]